MILKLQASFCSAKLLTCSSQSTPNSNTCYWFDLGSQLVGGGDNFIVGHAIESLLSEHVCRALWYCLRLGVKENLVGYLPCSRKPNYVFFRTCINSILVLWWLMKHRAFSPSSCKDDKTKKDRKPKSAVDVVVYCFSTRECQLDL